MQRDDPVRLACFLGVSVWYDDAVRAYEVLEGLKERIPQHDSLKRYGWRGKGTQLLWKRFLDLECGLAATRSQYGITPRAELLQVNYGRSSRSRGLPGVVHGVRGDDDPCAENARRILEGE
ncbi:MAG: hypothetical protein HC945_03630 [Nitrosarchaeum sp.]|nr:hypothetical protein [Nitrosarchaeum sp.]